MSVYKYSNAVYIIRTSPLAQHERTLGEFKTQAAARDRLESVNKDFYEVEIWAAPKPGFDLEYVLTVPAVKL